MEAQRFYLVLVIHNLLHATAPVYYTLASVNSQIDNAHRDSEILRLYGVQTLIVKQDADCLENVGDIYILKM